MKGAFRRRLWGFHGRRCLLEVLHISRHGAAKNRCCSRICGVARKFRINVGKYSDIKGSESTDSDLSTVPTGCCKLRICVLRTVRLVEFSINLERRKWSDEPLTMGTRIVHIKECIHRRAERF
ncbi:hypothetical protein AVEN_165332-1 [Araneus ventricosus]|uniref:Uncharacterized protein n=1 Tax=Araneus ventricosus TaxID=182803 RepID=A0A4Y2ATS4_ARAVE|nr:hypothetical protein AVEN_165332-1 [Araneus ventricosus]